MYVNIQSTLTLQILAFVLLLRHVFQTFEDNSDDYMYTYMYQTKNTAAGLHPNGKSLLTYICKASSVTPPSQSCIETFASCTQPRLGRFALSALLERRLSVSDQRSPASRISICRISVLCSLPSAASNIAAPYQFNHNSPEGSYHRSRQHRCPLVSSSTQAQHIIRHGGSFRCSR
jgi:hypothetical protein